MLPVLRKSLRSMLANISSSVKKCEGLVRPQPSERSRGQEGVDQAVHCRLDRDAPGAAIPNRHLPQRQRVSEEGGGSGEAEDLKEWRAGGQRAPRHIRGEKADDCQIEEPQNKVPPHRPWAVWQNGEHHDRPLVQLLEKLR